MRIDIALRFFVILCVFSACSDGRGDRGIAAPPPSMVSATTSSASGQPSSAPMDDDTPAEQRCDREIGAPEVRRGWPAAALRDVVSGRREGAVEIVATLDRVLPGYDCGGSRTECEGKLRRLLLEASSADGSKITLRDDGYGVGSVWVVGAKYALSIVSCGTAGSKYFALRGGEVVGRTRGADVTCVGGGPTGPLEAWPERAIAELARHLVEPGGFNTEGIVVRRFEPTPCPPNARCKPQPPPYVEVADKVDEPRHTLVLETHRPNAIPMQRVLQLSVVLCGTRSYGGTANSGILRAFLAK